ncbi:MAG: aspartate carbamoyltransferase catalytic subunit [Selenomonadaceae bacterium]|nr:aspartate carbamoyltransferase catalytic subunit [Selenomonadaceae bacterium]
MDKNSNICFCEKNIIGLEDFTAEEIRVVLDTAKDMKKIICSGMKKLNNLRGKAIVNLFCEPSTRTRTSFELAGKYLGADVVSINASTSSIVKGESLRDTLRTIEAMGVDAVVIRHKAEGSAEYASKVIKSVIINAGDGAHAHPSQALLDLFTIEQFKHRLEGLKVAIVGDILHSRVARSDIFGMTKMGMEIHLAGPKTLLPRYFEFDGVQVHDNVEDAIKNADVINVLRIQLERQQAGLFPSPREYARVFGINDKRLKLAKDDVLVLHPGPQNKGLEISNSVTYGEHSAIHDQVTNGVAVRMALLNLTLCGGKVVSE